jgi:hypothetical protein
LIPTGGHAAQDYLAFLSVPVPSPQPRSCRSA